MPFGFAGFVVPCYPQAPLDKYGRAGDRGKDHEHSGGTPANDAAQNYLTSWTNLYQGLAASLNGNRLTDLEPYQRWARIVARFSFTL